MCLHFFALRIEPTRLLATQVTDQTAAASLDAGESILYGTDEDLRSLARRLRLPLVTVARGQRPRRPNFEARGGAGNRRASAPKVFAEVA